jgi:hypothetical protein
MAASGCTATGTLFGTTVPRVWNSTAQRSRLGDVALVLFLLAQCFDGVFTYVGVVTLGIHVEANPLVAGLMIRFGEGLGLLGAKLVAAVLGIGLHLRQVHVAVGLLAVFYYAVAIVPWTAMLFL